MKDIGQVKNYIGIEIEYNYNQDILILRQKYYIESLAKPKSKLHMLQGTKIIG